MRSFALEVSVRAFWRQQAHVSCNQLRRLQWLQLAEADLAIAGSTGDTASTLLERARAAGAFATLLRGALFVFAEVDALAWSELASHCAASRPWSIDDVDDVLQIALLHAVRDYHRARWALVPDGAYVEARAPAKGLWHLHSCIAGGSHLVTGVAYSPRSPWRLLTVSDCVRAECGAGVVSVCVAGMGVTGRLIGLAECSAQAARLIAADWRRDYLLSAHQPERWAVLVRGVRACGCVNVHSSVAKVRLTGNDAIVLAPMEFVFCLLERSPPSAQQPAFATYAQPLAHPQPPLQRRASAEPTQPSGSTVGRKRGDAEIRMLVGASRVGCVRMSVANVAAVEATGVRVALNPATGGVRVQSNGVVAGDERAAKQLKLAELADEAGDMVWREICSSVPVVAANGVHADGNAQRAPRQQFDPEALALLTPSSSLSLPSTPLSPLLSGATDAAALSAAQPRRLALGRWRLLAHALWIWPRSRALLFDDPAVPCAAPPRGPEAPPAMRALACLGESPWDHVPAWRALEPPKVRCRLDADVVDVLPPVVEMWDKCRLSPIGDKKAVQFVVFAPERLAAASRLVFSVVSSLWSSHYLGSHSPAPLAASTGGVVALAHVGPAALVRAWSAFRKGASTGASAELVAYIVWPTSATRAELLSLLALAEQDSATCAYSSNCVLQLVPEATVTNPAQWALSGLRELSLSVFALVRRYSAPWLKLLADDSGSGGIAAGTMDDDSQQSQPLHPQPHQQLQQQPQQPQQQQQLYVHEPPFVLSHAHFMRTHDKHVYSLHVAYRVYDGGARVAVVVSDPSGEVWHTQDVALAGVAPAVRVWQVLRRCLPVGNQLRWRVSLLEWREDASAYPESGPWQRLIDESDTGWLEAVHSVLVAVVYRNDWFFFAGDLKHSEARLPSGTRVATDAASSFAHCCVAAHKDVALLVGVVFAWNESDVGGACEALASELALLIQDGGRGAWPAHIGAVLDFASLRE